jgi:hypothetical protein
MRSPAHGRAPFRFRVSRSQAVENDCFPEGASLRVARVGAAVGQDELIRESTIMTRGLSRPTPCLRPEQLSRELEGEDARKRPRFRGGRVDAEPQRSAEKARGRAGSPTRATRDDPSLSHVLHDSRALP